MRRTDDKLRAEGREQALHMLMSCDVEGGLDHCIDSVMDQVSGASGFRWNEGQLRKLFKLPPAVEQAEDSDYDAKMVTYVVTLYSPLGESLNQETFRRDAMNPEQQQAFGQARMDTLNKIAEGTGIRGMYGRFTVWAAG